MNGPVGLNPQKVADNVALLNGYLAAIDGLITDITTTRSAATNPALYGRGPGDLTIAPWSRHNLTLAINDLNLLRNSHGALTVRAGTETGSQQTASGNSNSVHDSGFLAWLRNNSAYEVYSTARQARSFLLSTPRSLLQLPAATVNIARHPWTVSMMMNPRTWFSTSWYGLGSEFLSYYATNPNTSRWIRGPFQAAGALRPSSWWSSAGGRVLDWGLNRPPGGGAWLNQADDVIARGTRFISAADTWLGKGLGVFGAGVGAIQFGTGVAGWIEDGQLDSEDAWAMADGAVGMICGIGSLAPPPVGVVFAAVGGVYALSRWIGSGDAAEFFTGVGEWASDAWSNTTQFLGNVGTQAVEGLGNAWDATTDFVSNLWPW